MSGGLNREPEGSESDGVKFEKVPTLVPGGVQERIIAVLRKPIGVDSEDNFDPDLGGVRREAFVAEHAEAQAKAAEAAMQVVRSDPAV